MENDAHQEYLSILSHHSILHQHHHHHLFAHKTHKVTANMTVDYAYFMNLLKLTYLTVSLKRATPLNRLRLAIYSKD